MSYLLRIEIYTQAARMKNYELWSQSLFCCPSLTNISLYSRSIKFAIALGHSLSEASSSPPIRQPDEPPIIKTRALNIHINALMN